MKINTGLEFMTLRSRPEVRYRVGHLTERATQAPLDWEYFLKIFWEITVATAIIHVTYLILFKIATVIKKCFRDISQIYICEYLHNHFPRIHFENSDYWVKVYPQFFFNFYFLKFICLF